MIRPSWDEYFLGLAFIVSARSRDPRTKHGAVLTKNNTIISTGYNSFVSGVDDTELPLEPNENPALSKYTVMEHAEKNCILSAKIEDKSNTVLYVTGKPCISCLQDMLQFGIKDIVYAKRQIPTTSKYVESEDMKNLWDWFVKQKNATVQEVKVDLTWIKEILGTQEKCIQ